jgi:3-deoxy-D-arabino-heptulosonate 7-phosphate (DAHP) synthase class II
LSLNIESNSKANATKYQRAKDYLNKIVQIADIQKFYKDFYLKYKGFINQTISNKSEIISKQSSLPKEIQILNDKNRSKKKLNMSTKLIINENESNRNLDHSNIQFLSHIKQNVSIKLDSSFKKKKIVSVSPIKNFKSLN